MILKYLSRKELALTALAALLILGQAYLELEIPGHMSEITSYLTGGGTVDDVISAGIPMMVCAVMALVLAVITGALVAYIATSFCKRIRAMQFDRVESFSMAEMGRFSPASLITRSTNDVTQVQTVLAMGMQVIIKAPFIAALAVLKIADENWQWTTATAFTVVAVLVVIGVIMAYVLPRYKKIQWLTDNVNRITGENITGLRVIRAYNAEAYQTGRFEGANTDLTDTNLSTNRALAFLMPSMTLLMSLLTLIIYVIGAFLISGTPDAATRYILFSDMVVFSSYAMMIVMAFVLVVIVLMMLPRATVAARRIEEVINTESSVVDGTLTQSPEGVVGEVEFRDVSFKYPGATEYALKDVSFKASKGDRVAFIGATGSGKTTLVNLVPRFYDVTEGQILVDGVDVREYKLETLNGKLGYVPQKAIMMSGTVSSNVNYGDKSSECTEEDVKRAVAIAQGTEFIEKMEGGYEGRVAENGTNLSGGQKQRISIARAVCRSPEIYIFDDSFSALDYKTDRVLRSTLRREAAGATSLIVAQRVGTIMDADMIIVLDDGKVVGTGTHKELLKTCDIYLEIAKSQLSEEELGS